MEGDRDYSHRSAVQKLGVKPDTRVEVDGAVVLVESLEEAEAAIHAYRPRLRDTGYLWLITRKRGHERYLNQMQLVPFGKLLGMIDNKTCSIDDERSGIRFVIPRALRG